LYEFFNEEIDQYKWTPQRKSYGKRMLIILIVAVLPHPIGDRIIHIQVRSVATMPHKRQNNTHAGARCSYHAPYKTKYFFLMCLKMPLALIDTKILSSTERCETITLIKTHPQQCTVSLPHLKNDFLIIFHSCIFITFSKNVSFFSCFSILFRAIYI